MIALLDKLTDLPDKRNAVDLIYLEFSKAFNLFPHGTLLVKLDKIEISARTRRWEIARIKETT